MCQHCTSPLLVSQPLWPFSSRPGSTAQSFLLVMESVEVCVLGFLCLENLHADARPRTGTVLRNSECSLPHRPLIGKPLPFPTVLSTVQSRTEPLPSV